MENYTSHIKALPKEFQKISNPHLKKKIELEKLTEDSQQNQLNNENMNSKTENLNKVKYEVEEKRSKREPLGERSEKPNMKTNINDKNSHAKELLSNGYIESFVDYYYLASRKTPDIKSKYEKEHNIIIETVHQSRGLSYQYDMSFLKKIKDLLWQAEDFLRNGGVNHAIEKYTELVYTTQYTTDILGPIYFTQKCINLAKRYNLIKQLIRALIAMGNRFDNTFNSEDLILSMSFKEEAKKLYRHLNDKDYTLESNIYNSLIQLYKELSNQAENQNNYDKAIEYLNKQLDNLKNLSSIIPNIKEEKDKEKEYIDQQIEVYLKIADLNFKMKYYKETLDCLEILKPLVINNNESSNAYLIRGLYLYAQTYEAQEQYTKAIECLNLIEQKIEISMQATEDNIFAKSLLNLGRLHFRQDNLELSYKNLKSFFKKAKSTDNKELLDIGRVNLGMIRGTQGKESYIKMIKESDFKTFLNLKLKYFADAN